MLASPVEPVVDDDMSLGTCACWLYSWSAGYWIHANSTSIGCFYRQPANLLPYNA
ncbi:hypothetical protein [Caldicoprobacter algeriensis]|uniref:hypothetical protein n=1 Tax=Caldicoprobacter algeriensis TaxID=699281 RepID=UPI00207B0B29|nr:hypothetical protein [Caldicoprobacter algeriensis]